MKFAMLTAIAILTTGANAADFGTCNHEDLHPTDIGYSVSAQRLAEDEEHGRQVAPSRPSECGPTSIGYTVSARRAANENLPSYRGESYTSNSSSYGSSVLDGSQGYYPASNQRSSTVSRSQNGRTVAPDHAVLSEYPRVAPTYSRVAVPMYSPYARLHHSSPYPATPKYAPGHYSSHSTGHGGPNSGKRRVGGVGSSGKGGHYESRY